MRPGGNHGRATNESDDGKLPHSLVKAPCCHDGRVGDGYDELGTAYRLLESLSPDARIISPATNGRRRYDVHDLCPGKLKTRVVRLHSQSLFDCYDWTDTDKSAGRSTFSGQGGLWLSLA